MRCPFLQEARVGQCSCSALRVMVVRPPSAAGERCSSGDYGSCPVYREKPDDAGAVGGKCPYLDEAPVQYCSAAAVVKYIRPSDSPLSRCGNDRHRYCDVYLALATAGTPPQNEWVENIRVPSALWYAPNHMWIDPGENGTCFVGIDGFLAAVLGKIERLRFLATSGVRRPIVMVTVRGVDLELVFPHPMPITGIHSYLRASPSGLTLDPYGQGWLFECANADLTGLMRGEEARRWMKAEVHRMTEYVHEHLVPRGMLADGGAFQPGLAEHLDKDQLHSLFAEFF